MASAQPLLALIHSLHYVLDSGVHFHEDVLALVSHLLKIPLNSINPGRDISLPLKSGGQLTHHLLDLQYLLVIVDHHVFQKLLLVLYKV